MADQIKIKNLKVNTRRPDGTVLDLTVNAVLFADTREAGLTDELAKSVDCGAVCQLIAEYAKKHAHRLLESYAEHLAEEILTEIPQLEQVKLEIAKSGEDIQVPADTVSSRICRGWHTVDLSLGCNRGDRKTRLMNAVRRLEDDPKNRRLARSAVIEAQPYPQSGQPSYLNVAVEMQTLRTPRELLASLQEIEREERAESAISPGGRTLDIDILFYDDLVTAQNDLVIPHPDLQNRMYVLGPLSEICPGRLHPVFRKSVMRMRRELEHRQEKERETGKEKGGQT